MRALGVVVAFVLAAGVAWADPPEFLTCQTNCRAEERRCTAKCATEPSPPTCALDCRAGSLDCRSICVCREAERQRAPQPPMCRRPAQ